MSTARIDQVNVVVSDVDAAATFLGGLGVDVPDAPGGWQTHHRSVPSATSADGSTDEGAFGVDLDSSAFAHRWGGLDRSFTGVVVDVRVDERDEVDRLFARALELGARALAEPYDAFWGSRFATVEAPGPLFVGLMSVVDAAHRSRPPDPQSLT